MSDNLTPKQRSYTMSRIRSRGNSSTELKLIRLMRGAGISGWRRKSNLCGRPDFVFPKYHVAVFVDGCYWHGCRRCALSAKTNTEYWKAKIVGNVKRDRTNTRKLKDDGWSVIRIWEHDLKAKPMKCLAKIMSALRPSA
ncbi:MAG: very short patch repair endonuclease [Nitrososphaera sp.]